ncbi:MAG: hypothetical protein K0Q87_4548 [Neobacillus sp.]|jgi:hypothetical protein|nr:hypothetical protein [Neobacillus sp.]
MDMNKISIVQNDYQYLLYLPNNTCIGQIAFPNDHQYLQDAKALEPITKALSARWGIAHPFKKHKLGRGQL